MERSYKKRLLILFPIILIIIYILNTGAHIIYKDKYMKEVPTKSLINNYDNIKIVYSTGNKSVPPPFNMMNTLTISKLSTGEIVGEWNVYNGGVATKTSVAVSLDKFEDLVNRSLTLTQPNDSLVSCPGGITRLVRVYKSDKIILETSSYDCDGISNNESVDNLAIKIGEILPIAN